MRTNVALQNASEQETDRWLPWLQIFFQHSFHRSPSMFRLSHQLGHARCLARSSEILAEKKLEHGNTPVPLTPQALEKLSMAVRRIATAKATHTAHAQSHSTSQAPSTPKKPLPVWSRVVVTPFLKAHHHHQCERQMSTAAFRIETWKPEQRPTPMHIQNNNSTTTLIPALSTTGFSSFLRHVYLATGVSLSGTVAASYAIVALGLIPSVAAVPIWLGSAVTMLGSMWALSFTSPAAIARTIDPGHLFTVNKWHRKLAFSTLLASSAIVLTPLMAHLAHVSPLLVPIAVGASALSFVGAASVAKWRRSKGTSLQWQAPLGGALLAGGSLGLVGAGAFVLFGANGLSTVLLTSQPYLAVALLGALVAADSRAAVTEYRSGRADHLIHALTFHRSAVNFVLHLVKANFRRAPL